MGRYANGEQSRTIYVQHLCHKEGLEEKVVYRKNGVSGEKTRRKDNMLEFFDAAHHTRPNPQNLTHRPPTYPVPLSFRQRSIGHALGIDTPSGGEFFHAAPHVLHRCSLYRDRSTNLRRWAWD